MLFDVEPKRKSDGSIWEQIVSQVMFAIASGALEVGTLIPSVRAVADQLIVNPNTVAKAYQELERRGVVTSRRGMGMEVTTDAPDICRDYRQEVIRNRVRQALREAVSSALSPEEIRSLVEDELLRVNGSADGRGRKKTPSS